MLGNGEIVTLTLGLLASLSLANNKKLDSLMMMMCSTAPQATLRQNLNFGPEYYFDSFVNTLGQKSHFFFQKFP